MPAAFTALPAPLRHRLINTENQPREQGDCKVAENPFSKAEHLSNLGPQTQHI